ncbi:hypothetical protein [Micromonospora sp. DT227]|uniref:hypothetical protein n=1 Tax=Micromonospora sp. DT227 TaxID=3393433 RepID=UPI003CE88F59
MIKVGVEGTGTYGAGLARHLTAQGVAAPEALRHDLSQPGPPLVDRCAALPVDETRITDPVEAHQSRPDRHRRPDPGPDRRDHPSRPAAISWQATKTWKASTDPDFATKMRRILDLYDHPPADGRVICVDEFGPLNLQPRPGRAWRPVAQPVRLRATYTRDQGVRHMIAALDLAGASCTTGSVIGNAGASS